MYSECDLALADSQITALQAIIEDLEGGGDLRDYLTSLHKFKPK